jgi:hypothetical protein
LVDAVPVAKDVAPAIVMPEPAGQATTSTPSALLPAAETGALPATIAEVMARLPTLDDLSDRRRRDMLSALRKVCSVAGKRPDEVPATATSMRAIFASTSPAAIRVGKGRWNNLRCLALDALRRVGLPALQSRANQPMSLAWEALRDRLPDVAFRAGLSRFMGWCSAAGIDPSRVTQADFDEYAVALREGTARVDPKQVFRTTCVLWNRAAAEIDVWPTLLVTVPEAQEIWQMATAPANAGVDIDAITTLAVLVAPDNAKRLLRFLYDRHDEQSVYLYHQAALLRTIARHCVRAPETELGKVSKYATNLAVKRNFMTDKNRERLRQFDNPANVRTLLTLPQKIFADVRRKDAVALFLNLHRSSVDNSIAYRYR